MISGPRHFTQTLLTWAVGGRLGSSEHHDNDRSGHSVSKTNAMVVPPRSPKAETRLTSRSNARADQDANLKPSAREQEKVVKNAQNSSSIARLSLSSDDGPSAGDKRARQSSTSSRATVRKRAKLGANLDSARQTPGPAPTQQARIPVRARRSITDDGQPAALSIANALRGEHKSTSLSTPQASPSRPLLPHQESALSTSSTGSPSYRPQYDQFQRIQAKAAQLARNEAAHDNSTRNGAMPRSPKEEKRKLRSEHGNTRSKTELAQYFPNFEELISLADPDPDLLTAKTKFVLIDDIPPLEPPPPPNDPYGAHKPLFNTQVIDLDSYARSTTNSADPLNDAVYLKAHLRAERHEKQIKNGDKERAQHEKYQLEHILEELRGPDWLKTLGISGITDGEKRRYEVKRALFIRETKTLISKFHRWKEEEKRRRYERARAHTSADDDSGSEHVGIRTPAKRPSRPSSHALSDADQDSEDVDERKRRTRNEKRRAKYRSRRAEELASKGLPPMKTKILDSPRALPSQSRDEEERQISQQLHREAQSSTALVPRQQGPSHVQQNKRQSTLPFAPSLHQQLDPSPEVVHHTPKPFNSFFDKPHIREAALAGRLRGRHIYAFGVQVPDPPWQADFELPEYILTEEAVLASERRMRRLKRKKEDDA